MLKPDSKNTAPLAEQVADLTRRLETLESIFFPPKPKAESPTERRFIPLTAMPGEEPRPVLLQADRGRNAAFIFVSRIEASRFHDIHSLQRSFTVIRAKGFEISWAELTDAECAAAHKIELERQAQAEAAAAEANRPRKYIILAGKEGEPLQPVHLKGNAMTFSWDAVERTRADVYPDGMTAVRAGQMLRIKGFITDTSILSDEEAANSRPIVEPPAKLPGRNVFDTKVILTH